MEIKLHYVEKGSGEPLILLHGNSESSSYFIHQISYFSKKYRVIAIDTRGHGWSPRGTKPFTITQFAEDLYDFMKDREIEQANILGFSDGGNIALVFALNHPECVKRLILNGANLYPEGVKEKAQLPIMLGYKIAGKFSKKYRRALEKEEMLGLMVNEPNICPEELDKLNIKTLVIAGTDDLIKEEHTQLIYERLPKARLVFIKGDHFIATKCPKVFNRAVEKFFNA